MKNLTNLPMSRRSVLAGASGLAAAGILAGCSSSSSSDSSTGSEAGSGYETVSLRVAYMPNLNSASSLFAAIDQGYFAEYGLDVEPQQFETGPSEITAMQSGDIDISQIGHGAHSLCLSGDATIFQFDSISQSDEVVVNKSVISSAEELAGKTIGVSSGTSSEIILTFVLRDAGLTTDDVNLVEMDVSGMTTALITGQIDAAATWSPNTVTIANELGDDYLCLGTNNDYIDEVAFPSSWVCLPSYADENAEVLARFGAAIQKAHAYRVDNIDDVAIVLANELDVDEDTMLQSTGEGNWAAAAEAAGDDDTIRAYYEAQQQVFLSNGTIEEAIDVDEYVRFDIMDEAYELTQE